MVHADGTNAQGIGPVEGRRWVLAIEASNPSASGEGGRGPGLSSVAGVVLGGNGDPAGVDPAAIVEEAYEAGSRREDGLLPAVERVRERLGVSPGALARVCVSVGPGGYTGLRVSVTVAKSIAMATGADLVAVPSASVAIGDLKPGGAFLVCLASKGDRTHATRFAGPGVVIGDPIGVIGAEDLPRLGEKILIGDRYLPEPFRLSFLQGGGEVLSPRFSASRCLTVGCGLAPVDPAGLVPVYAREPEAVRLWRQRHG
jgi:tRNA A37 threonylcarbamoyladenosine modification protein TsaB